LQSPSFRPLHVFAHALDTTRIHSIVHERPLLEQVLDLHAVNRVGDRLRETRAHLRSFAVANSFDEQLAERSALKLELAQYIEHLTAECFAGILQLLEQSVVDVALPGLQSDEIP